MTLMLNYPNQTHSLLGDAVDGTNGEERHESEDASVSAYATAAVTENVIVSFPAVSSFCICFLKTTCVFLCCIIIQK